MREMVLYKMPLEAEVTVEARALKTGLQVEGWPIHKLARRVDDIREKQSIVSNSSGSGRQAAM